MAEMSAYERLTASELFGNTADLWGAGLLTALVSFFAIRLLFGFLATRLQKLSKRTKTVLDDLVGAALEATRWWVVLIAAIWLGSQWLSFDPQLVAIDYLFLVAMVMQVALWANRLVSAYIDYYTNARREANPAAVSVAQGLSFVVRLAIWSVALLLALDNLGYDVTALVAGLGIGGIAVALALQNVLGDLFASLSIILDKPFVLGDFIIVGDSLGVVEKIGLKTTRVRSLSGEQLIFANSDLLSSRIRNFKRMQERRIAFGFGVLYQTTPEQLEAIPGMVKGIIEGQENARFDRAHFKGFGESAYDFEVVYFLNTPDYVAYMDCQQAINLGICRGLAERGVEFAYPTRTIYLHGASDEAKP
jgi:small-conductance mechanosensitive channel